METVCPVLSLTWIMAFPDRMNHSTPSLACSAPAISTVHPVLLQLYLFGNKSYVVMIQCVYKKDSNSEDHRAVTNPQVALTSRAKADLVLKSKELSWAWTFHWLPPSADLLLRKPGWGGPLKGEYWDWPRPCHLS